MSDNKPGCRSLITEGLIALILPALLVGTIILSGLLGHLLTVESSTGYISYLTHHALITPNEEMRWEGEITTTPKNKTFTVTYRKSQYNDCDDWYGAVDISSNVRIIDDNGNGTVSRVRICNGDDSYYLRPASSEEWQKFQYLYELTVRTMKAELENVEEPMSTSTPTPAPTPPPPPPTPRAKAKPEPPPQDDPWAAFRD